MKFACDSCGRGYVADEKVRGRAFKMRCKQCGHLIVVKAAATAPQATAGAEAPEASTGTPTPIDLRAGEVQEVTSLTPLPEELVALPIAEASEEDPFATLAEELKVELAGVPEAPPLAPRDLLAEPPDPFLAAASVPGARAAPKLSESDEVFADLSRQMDAATGATPLLAAEGEIHRTPPVPAPPRAPAAPPAPVERRAPDAGPRSPRRRWMAAVVGVGVGVAGAAVVGALVVSSPASKPAADSLPAATAQAAPQPGSSPAQAPAPAPPAPAPVAVAPPPAAPPRTEPAPRREEPPAPRAAPAPRARPKSPPRAAERTREKPRREPPRKEPTRKEPARVAEARSSAPTPPAAAPAVAPAAAPTPPVDEAPPPSSGSSDRPLDPRELEAAITQNARKLNACLAAARKSEPQFLDGHLVNVTMTVNPNGRGMYPTLDDVELNGTDLGACLKREAGRMSFPEFAGEPVRARIPVTLK